jgi:uncharacterized protein YciI
MFAKSVNSFSLLFVAALLCSTRGPSATAGPEASPTPSPPRSTFLVIYRPGPGWLPGKPISEQPLKEHGKYMLSLYVKGSLRFAGPFTDNAGGAVVLDVAGESDAKAIVLQDPAVKTGVFVYELHPWRLVPWENHVKK